MLHHPRRPIRPVRRNKRDFKPLHLATLRVRCPLDNGRHAFPPPRESVGGLQVLPLELLHKILVYLDLPALTAFRATNRLAMLMGDSAPGYAWIVENFPDVLRAVLVVGARHYSCAFLYDGLHRSNCCDCNGREKYLSVYLITGELVCARCRIRGRKTRKYCPLSAHHVRELQDLSGLPDRVLMDLPCATVLPAGYTGSPYLDVPGDSPVAELYDGGSVCTKLQVDELEGEWRLVRDLWRWGQVAIPFQRVTDRDISPFSE